MDHYENPRNVGSLDKNAKNVGTGLVGAPACGDVMKLQVSLFRLLNFYLYITIYISDFLLWTCLTDSGGREWQDSRRQIQNIWLWLSHCFQLTGHRVGEGKIGESLWLRPLHKFSVIRLPHCASYLFSQAFLPTFQCSFFYVQIDEALKIKNTEIAKELSLPPVKLHCSSKCNKMAVWDCKHVDGIKKKSSDFLNLFFFFFLWQCLQRMLSRLH